MQEHIGSAREFPQIDNHTSYSFGLDDQEFVVAFEADDPAAFLDLVQRLRTTEASGWTKRDTPRSPASRPRSSARSTRSTAPRSPRASRCSGMPPRRPGSDPRRAGARRRLRRRRRRRGARRPIRRRSVPSGIQAQVRAAQDPQASEFPRSGGQVAAGTGQPVRAQRWAGPGLAQQRLHAGPAQPAGLRRDRRPAEFVYGPSAIDFAQKPVRDGSAAPAWTMLVTDPPYRSQQAATEKDPFAAVYAAEVELDKPGTWSVLIVTKTGGLARSRLTSPDRGGQVVAHSRGRTRRPGRRHRHGGERQGRHQVDRHARPARATCTSRASRTSLARSRWPCCSRRPSSASRASAGRWSTSPPQLKQKYGDRVEFIHQEVYVDNVVEKGLRKPLVAVRPADRALAVRRRRRRPASRRGSRAPSASDAFENALKTAL